MAGVGGVGGLDHRQGVAIAEQQVAEQVRRAAIHQVVDAGRSAERPGRRRRPQPTAQPPSAPRWHPGPSPRFQQPAEDSSCGTKTVGVGEVLAARSGTGASRSASARGRRWWLASSGRRRGELTEVRMREMSPWGGAGVLAEMVAAGGPN
jgi:hypothetical protein